VSCLASQISHILWKPEFHYLVHKSLPLVPLLCYMNPTMSSRPISVRSVGTLSSHLHIGLASGLVFSGFCTKHCTHIFSRVPVTCLAHLILPALITHKMLVRIMILEASNYALFFCLPFLIFGPNVFFKTLFLGHPQFMFLPYCVRPSCLQRAEL